MLAKSNVQLKSQVLLCWEKLLEEEKQATMRELSTLSLGQRKLLLAIASGQSAKFTSKQFLQTINMAGSTVSEALEVLVQKDYIDKIESDLVSYHIIDPAIVHILKQHYSARL